jgi:hypothetical protein
MIGEALHQGFPGEPEFRPTMEEEQHRTAAGTRDMKGCTIGLDAQVLHGFSPSVRLSLVESSAAD